MCSLRRLLVLLALVVCALITGDIQIEINVAIITTVMQLVANGESCIKSFSRVVDWLAQQSFHTDDGCAIEILLRVRLAIEKMLRRKPIRQDARRYLLNLRVMNHIGLQDYEALSPAANVGMSSGRKP